MLDLYLFIFIGVVGGVKEKRRYTTEMPIYVNISIKKRREIMYITKLIIRLLSH